MSLEDIVNQNIRNLKEYCNLDVDKISDGFHTFESLYSQRSVLFAALCNTHKDLSWKSKKHSDGSMFEGYFIVGINTPKGQYTYHYELKDWGLFNVKEIDRAPEWDGHTDKDVKRLLDLEESDEGNI